MIVLVSFAAVTNYHKLNGFKPRKFILLEFWASEVQNESQGVKKESVGRPGSFWRLQGESESLSFPAFRGHLDSSAPCPLLPPSTCTTATSVSTVPSPAFLTLLPPFYKDPCDHIRPSWIIRDTRPISKSLI